MRGKKTREETKAKVTEIKIQNIELSSYDIAKILEWTEYEVSADTIQDILKELQVESISDKSDDEISAIISQIKDKYGLEYTANELKDSSTKVKVYTVFIFVFVIFILKYPFVL